MPGTRTVHTSYSEPYEEGGDSIVSPLLWLGIFGIGAFFFFKKIIQPQVIRPSQMFSDIERMQITNPRVHIDTKGKRVLISFTINNPNNHSLQIAAITGTVSVHQNDPTKPGLNIGQIDRFSPINIKALSANPVTLTVPLRTVNTLTYLIEVFTGRWQGQILTFSGTVNANGHPYPVHESINLTV